MVLLAKPAMQILIINPNSDPIMTKTILLAAERFVQQRYIIQCRLTPGAPKFIETYQDMVQAAPGMAKLMQENLTKFDAFVIACHYDPNLAALREISDKPVIGIGEASMMMAAMLGHRFSIVTTDPHSVPIHLELAQKYLHQDRVASVRAPDDSWADKEERTRFLLTARAAITEDRAEVIVLGCAGLTGLDKYIQNELQVPVIDGIFSALIMAEGMIKYGK